MERLTNNYGDVHEEVKKELLSFDIAKNEECIMYYLEMPWFPGGQFSLFLLRDILTNHYKVIEKCGTVSMIISGFQQVFTI